MKLTIGVEFPSRSIPVNVFASLNQHSLFIYVVIVNKGLRYEHNSPKKQVREESSSGETHYPEFSVRKESFLIVKVFIAVGPSSEKARNG